LASTIGPSSTLILPSPTVTRTPLSSGRSWPPPSIRPAWTSRLAITCMASISDCGVSRDASAGWVMIDM
jgi:hypothetical protein